MKFSVLCILLGAPLALAGKRQGDVDSRPFPANWDPNSGPLHVPGRTTCRDVCSPDPTYSGPDLTYVGPDQVHRWQPPTCRLVCDIEAPDDATAHMLSSRYRRNINANIIEIREAPAKAIAIGLPPPLLGFGDERILRDESNEEVPIAERNETDYGRRAPIG